MLHRSNVLHLPHYPSHVVLNMVEASGSLLNLLLHVCWCVCSGAGSSDNSLGALLSDSHGRLDCQGADGGSAGSCLVLCYPGKLHSGGLYHDSSGTNLMEVHPLVRNCRHFGGHG